MKKIADAVLVAMMLMASVPALAEDAAAILMNDPVQEQADVSLMEEECVNG
ncbi:MAG: hypothetical protein IJ507_09355 [Clostridia bacterium]|nr:hypothetical protein [Clostridia bacterium]